MPQYYEDGEEHDDDKENYSEKSRTTNIALWKPLLFLTFFYYLISCGIERIYQPMVNKLIIFIYNLELKFNLILATINSTEKYIMNI